MTRFYRLLDTPTFQCSILVLLTFLLRIIGASKPYFADAFRHIHAIESGMLVIHPPGYFLFNATGSLISHFLHVSTGSALQIMNITFSVSGAAVFYLLVSRLTTIPFPFWLSLAYACSPIVWFSGDVHSTYAALTLFSPLLILIVEGERRFVLGCIVWALMTGFRPADGVFVIPWMAFQSLRFGWKDRLIGISVAIPIVAAWWIPTAERYRGSLLSPLIYSGDQVNSVAQGLLTGHLGVHALVNAVHAIAGFIMTWGVLTPAVCLGVTAWRRNGIARSMAILMVPGLAFFLLYYVADAPYVVYLAAPGMILAGGYLAKWPTKRRITGYAVAISASVLFMFFARTANGSSSKTRAVADAFFLKYSVPSLREQKDPRLASLLGACKDRSVLGVCK